MAQWVKNPPVMQETQVRSLGQEDPLEKGMATHSPASLPGESHGQSILVGYSPWGRKEFCTTRQLTLSPWVEMDLSKAPRPSDLGNGYILLLQIDMQF